MEGVRVPLRNVLSGAPLRVPVRAPLGSRLRNIDGKAVILTVTTSLQTTMTASRRRS